MPSKRIAILVGGLPPVYTGGTEIATAKIAEYATRVGHDVHVISASDHPTGKDDSRRDRPFFVHEVRTVPARYIRGLTYIPGATWDIVNLKPDLIHAQAAYCAPAALLASKLTGIPYLFYERGGVSLPSLALNKCLYPLFLRYARRVVAQTEHQKGELEQYTSRIDIEVIPNGVETDKFGRLSKREAREVLGIPSSRKVVLAVGRCRPEKNLSDFVKAAKCDTGNTIYVLVGDGPELHRLEQAADGRVTFTGHVDNGAIHTYMSAADVLVNTSLTEGFPMAILEALASGLPMVAPAVCGIPEIVDDGVNGILTTVGDYTSTARAIDEILGNTALASCIAENNRLKARLYTWEMVVEKLYG